LESIANADSQTRYFPSRPEETPDKQTKATFVSNTAKNPDLFSQGEKILLNSTPNKEKGAAAFKKEDWANAIAAYQLAATPQANDPEGKIYYNNAKARQKGNQNTIAVVVPIANDPNSAKEILRGWPGIKRSLIILIRVILWK